MVAGRRSKSGREPNDSSGFYEAGFRFPSDAEWVARWDERPDLLDDIVDAITGDRSQRSINNRRKRVRALRYEAAETVAVASMMEWVEEFENSAPCGVLAEEGARSA